MELMDPIRKIFSVKVHIGSLLLILFLAGCTTGSEVPEVIYDCNIRCPFYEIIYAEGQCDLNIDESKYSTLTSGLDVDDKAQRRIRFAEDPTNDFKTNVNFKYYRACLLADGKAIIAKYGDCIFDFYSETYYRCEMGGDWQWVGHKNDWCPENLDYEMCEGNGITDITDEAEEGVDRVQLYVEGDN